MAAKEIKPWKVKSSEYIVKDKYLTLRKDVCITQKDTVIDPYYVIESENWLDVFALDENNRVLLVKQYRHGTQSIDYEIPSGIIDGGENPADAALRELSEETGYTTERIEEVAKVYANPAKQNNYIYSFIAYNIRKSGSQQLDEGEYLKYELVEMKQFLKMLHQGKIKASSQLSTIFHALIKLNIIKIDNPG